MTKSEDEIYESYTILSLVSVFNFILNEKNSFKYFLIRFG